MMFLEKVFEAHFFRTAYFKVAKSFIFYTQQTKKPLNLTPIAVISMALSRLGNNFPCFPKHRWKEGSLLFTTI